MKQKATAIATKANSTTKEKEISNTELKKK
jgi:hypothetical protein